MSDKIGNGFKSLIMLDFIYFICTCDGKDNKL